MDPSKLQKVVDSFADRLRARRDHRGATQAATAEAIGVSENAYAQWERGQHFPRTQSIFALARFFEIGADELLFGSAPGLTSFDETGMSWSLAWSEPTNEQELAADYWLRLIQGETTARIADRYNVAYGDIERGLQDLILHDSIDIHTVARDPLLEEHVRSRFRLDERTSRIAEVRVAKVAHIDSELVRFALLGHVAKEYFIAEVKRGDSVGLCGGFAVSRMVYSLKRDECPSGIVVYPIAVSPTFEKAHVSANSLVGALGYRQYGLGVEAQELPFFVPGDTKGASHPFAQRAQATLEKARKVDFVFMGLGGLGIGALAANIFHAREYRLWANKASASVAPEAKIVGNILYYLVDGNGEMPEDFRSENESLVYSIGLNGLQDMVRSGKRVVVIALGADKGDVTRVAVEKQFANVLIIDDELARALLAGA